MKWNHDYLRVSEDLDYIIMASINLLESVFKVRNRDISEKERILLEMIFLKYLYSELMQTFAPKVPKWDGNMLGDSVIKFLINDLLLSEEYSLKGLAEYTSYCEDVIYDVALGVNRQPTLEFSAKIVELHFLARRDLYTPIINKAIKNIFTDIN